MKNMQELLAGFRAEHRGLMHLQDDNLLFSAFCAKYFFYEPNGVDFNSRAFWKNCIADRSKDGGIDAMFCEPHIRDDAETMGIIILQGKNYGERTPFTFKSLQNEIKKVSQTIADIKRGDLSKYNQYVKNVVEQTICQLPEIDERHYRVVYVTSWIPPKSRRRKYTDYCMRRSIGGNTTFEIKFGDDLRTQVEACLFGEERVEEGELILDKRGNVLKYEDSMIVNVMSRSIQALYTRYQHRVLGMNLRFHVEKNSFQRKIDEGMLKTIDERGGEFWYFNNGIVIVCKSMEFQGRKIVLKDFAIVNGGQTTYNIWGNRRRIDDFAVPCKIVVVKNDDGERFYSEIARYTNSQKPIDSYDLRSNDREQKEVEIGLRRCGVEYRRKAGGRKCSGEKRFRNPDMPQVFRTGVIGLLLMPGAVRTNPTKLFDDSRIYDQVFVGRKSFQPLADLLFLSYVAEMLAKKLSKKRRFLGRKLARGNLKAVIANGVYFPVAALSLLKRLECRVFTCREYMHRMEEKDLGKRVSFAGRMKGVKRIVPEHNYGQCEIFEPLIFSIWVMLEPFVTKAMADAKGTVNEPAATVTNLLKRDDLFCKDLVPAMWKAYRKRSSRFRREYEACMR